MAYMPGFANIISGTYPNLGDTKVPLDTEIRIVFIFDMIPDTVNTSNIVILNEKTERIPISLTYKDRVAVIKPDNNLDPGERYQVLIRGGVNGIKTVLEGTMSSDYIFDFITDVVTPVDQVILVHPDNRSIFKGIPKFVWREVPKVDDLDIYYEIEISTESKFGSVSFCTDSIVDTEIEPDFNFEHDTNYFWRVRAYNEKTKGLWSNPWQFRYVTTINGDSDGQQDNNGSTPYEDFATEFDIIDVYPKPDSLSVDPNTTIKIKFNQPVDLDSVSDNIAVFFEDVDGIGEPTNVFGQVYYSLEEENSIEFVPESGLSENGIYTVEIYSGITSISGQQLPDDTTWTFATVFVPYYSSVRAVRAEIGTFLETVPDLDIAREILAVSRWADQIAARPYGEINDDYLGETQSKTTNAIFYQNYTKFETCVRLLNRLITDHMQYHGKLMEIGDLKVKSSGSMTPDSNIVLKRLETLRNRAETYLTMGRQTYALPSSGIKGDKKYPYPLNKRNSF